MVGDYINEYVSFGRGEADELFFNRACKIVFAKYGSVIRKEKRYTISTEICRRAHDVTVRNLAQYMALMKIKPEDKLNWFGPSSRMMKSILRSSIFDKYRQHGQAANVEENAVANGTNASLPLTRKQRNMLRKTNFYKASILLHPSLIFLKSGLYINSSLKKASSLMDSNFLQELVAEEYLIAIPKGVICRKSKPTLYIKVLPLPDNDSKDEFIKRLATFNDVRLNYNSYMESCNMVSFDTMGFISGEIRKILLLERYQCLNVDYASVFQRVEVQLDDQDMGKCLIPFRRKKISTFISCQILILAINWEIRKLVRFIVSHKKNRDLCMFHLRS